ncbi:MAG TPA: TM0106 family RecB-like putative nuclease [Lacipirellulaceae bacterium]|nr:TM0106 family RecB-like putative nuclease [Lacipirellulaceae bacterium]
MRYLADRIVFSPSDLLVFLEGDFASWMDRWQLEAGRGDATVKNSLGLPLRIDIAGLSCQPDEMNDELQLIASKGLEHEAAYLQRLANEGQEVVQIDASRPWDQAVQLTVAAMRRGARYICQAALEHAEFAGFADFLVRQPGASDLGDYHYEAWDAKLARSIKPYFIVQLCAYSEMLAAIQGRRPSRFSVILGDGQQQDRSVQNYWYYYRRLRRSFLEFQQRFSIDGFPHPGLSLGRGRWTSFAADFLEATDHLSQVANISRTQIKRLEAAGIPTLSDLAGTKVKYIPRMAQPVFDRLKTQARLQLQSQGQARPRYAVVGTDGEDSPRGLRRLPPASSGDVYFDMEGFPLAAGGLEYLFGAFGQQQGELAFFDWWAHDHLQERTAFERFVDWVYARWQEDPLMHVYHYAAYEATALRKLMGKHATREREMDALLRNQVFVDLYAVVRQGLVVGTPGYSLKDIERLYMQPRAGGVTSAGGSIVAYHNWLTSGEDQDWRKSPLLKEIRDYNEVDCQSAWQLAQWLRQEQREAKLSYLRPSASPESAQDKPAGPAALLAARLLEQVQQGEVADPARSKMQELLAYLLEYHWREAKPVFWRMFARRDMSEQGLIDGFDCLGALERTAKQPDLVKRSLVYQYRFDPDQDTKLHEGSTCFFAHDLTISVVIEALDPERGLLEFKLGAKRDQPPDRLSLTPNEYVSAEPIAAAVFRYVEAWRQGNILSRAVDDLLQRRSPRLKGRRKTGPVITAEDDLLAGTIDVIGRMQDTVLCLQGPPGTGKTYKAAQAIVKLMEGGKRVAVAANSHKAILNVLRAIHEARSQSRSEFRIVKVGSPEDDPLVGQGFLEHIPSTSDAQAALGSGPLVMGGTAWLFSRPEFQGAFDYLFVDEAEQFSLANAVAVGLAAKNLVLVGDQMQLAQPLLGAHPGESGQSVLNYLLAGRATISPEMGVFFHETWRLHPAICQFISEAVYEGRLQSHPRTASRAVRARGPLIQRRAGITFVSVMHEGNSQASEEEADVIQQIVAELVGRQVVDGERKRNRPLTVADILVVAPFNMQVRLLKARLGATIQVGSVDKFQGQEAEVVIVSMCSSTLQDSPRGAEFLLEPNRLNVALTRAKSLAIVVGNPGLVAAQSQSIREMELANLFCWLVDYSNGEA